MSPIPLSLVCESLYEQIKRYNDSFRKIHNIARMQAIQQDTPATATASGGGGGAIARIPLRSTSSSRGIVGSGSGDGGGSGKNDIDGCYRAYEHARNRLLSSIAASRSLLVGMLGRFPPSLPLSLYLLPLFAVCALSLLP